MKICSKCKIQKEAKDFYTDRRKSTGLYARCKRCCKDETAVKSVDLDWKIHRREIAKKHYNTVKNTPKYKYRVYKRGALKRDLEFSLTLEEFESFWEQNCVYCNCKIETIGIDRLDGSKGYFLKNCVSCCVDCNMMKNNITIEMCKKIIQLAKEYNVY